MLASATPPVAAGGRARRAKEARKIASEALAADFSAAEPHALVLLQAGHIKKLFAGVRDARVLRLERVALATPIHLVFDARARQNSYEVGAPIELSAHLDWSEEQIRRRHGSRAFFLGLLAHELYLARMFQFRQHWLIRRGLPAALAPNLHTASEVYAAMLAEKRAMGDDDFGHRVALWVATGLTQRGRFPSFRPLDAQWRAKLRKARVRIPR
jgi:hypothetical protein